MNAMNRMATALLALVLLAWAPAAYAADNGTEFGIEDDLSVLGSGGTMMDPDAEIKGFTLFGSTSAAQTVNIPQAPGSIYVSGHVQVSSGIYAVGGSTFAAGGAYFTGVSSFSDVANVHYGGGAVGQVLKKVAGGGMVWANDDNTTMTFQTPYRIQMVNGTDTDLADSLFLQNAGNSNITMISGSSLTVTGAFGAGGAATLSNNLTVEGVTALNGNITMGNAPADLVTVNAQSSFVSGSTFTAGAYFTGVSSFSNVANVHYGGGAAGQVLSKAAGGGMQWSDVSAMVSGDNLGSHVATTTLNMSAFNISNAGYVTASSAALSGQMIVYGTSTLAGLVGMGGALNVNGDADLNAKLNVDGASTFVSSVTAQGNVQLGDAPGTDKVAVNMTAADARATGAMNVAGGSSAGDYVAKFYSGADIAAWIRKK